MENKLIDILELAEKLEKLCGEVHDIQKSSNSVRMAVHMANVVNYAKAELIEVRQ